MAYNYEYPYTDQNRSNADWLLNKMKELEGRLDGIVEETLKLTKEYVDDRLIDYQKQISGIRRDIKTLYDKDAELKSEMIRQVMRYSGPRMIFSHPILAVRHVCVTIKEKRKKE